MRGGFTTQGPTWWLYRNGGNNAKRYGDGVGPSCGHCDANRQQRNTADETESLHSS